MKHRRAIQLATGATAGVFATAGLVAIDDDSRFRMNPLTVSRSASPAGPGHDGSPFKGEEPKHDCSKVFTSACAHVDPWWEHRMSGGMMGYRV